MMSVGEYLIASKNKVKVICDSPHDIISSSFDGDKVDEDEHFYYKDDSISVQNYPNITNNLGC